MGRTPHVASKNLRSQIAYRIAEEEFIARGLKAAEDARITGTCHSAQSVLAEMKQRLESARSKLKSSPRRP
jgi:hypothetical protein